MKAVKIAQVGGDAYFFCRVDPAGGKVEACVPRLRCSMRTPAANPVAVAGQGLHTHRVRTARVVAMYVAKQSLVRLVGDALFFRVLNGGGHMQRSVCRPKPWPGAWHRQ